MDGWMVVGMNGHLDGLTFGWMDGYFNFLD